jgi:hypothetical protein
MANQRGSGHGNDSHIESAGSRGVEPRHLLRRNSHHNVDPSLSLNRSGNRTTAGSICPCVPLWSHARSRRPTPAPPSPRSPGRNPQWHPYRTNMLSTLRRRAVALINVTGGRLLAPPVPARQLHTCPRGAATLSTYLDSSVTPTSTRQPAPRDPDRTLRRGGDRLPQDLNCVKSRASAEIPSPIPSPQAPGQQIHASNSPVWRPATRRPLRGHSGPASLTPTGDHWHWWGFDNALEGASTGAPVPPPVVTPVTVVGGGVIWRPIFRS